MGFSGVKRGREKVRKFEYHEKERSFFVKPEIFFIFKVFSCSEIYEISGWKLWTDSFLSKNDINQKFYQLKYTLQRRLCTIISRYKS